MSHASPTAAGRGARATALLLTAGLVLAALAACGGGDDDDGDRAPTERTTTTLPDMPTDFDWWHPTEVDLGGGWVLQACGGDDPNLCFDHPDGGGGFVGLFRFDAPADFDLNAHAARFVEDFRNDRKAGCGPEYRVEAEPIDALDLPDGPARRYGFTGGSANSPDTERTIQWAGLRGTSLVIVTLSAYDPGSCVPAIGEATLEEQSAVLPGVHALILAAGLPDPAGAPPTTAPAG